MINLATETKSCYGLNLSGTANVNGGTLFTYGRTNGILINSGATLQISDNAALFAASGDSGMNDGFKGAYRGQSTGKFVQNNGAGKAFTSLRIAEGGPLAAGKTIAFQKLSGAAPTDEITVTLPADTYYVGFAGSIGSTYYLKTDNSYITHAERRTIQPGVCHFNFCGLNRRRVMPSLRLYPLRLRSRRQIM